MGRLLASPLLAVIAVFPLRAQPSQILVPGQSWTLLGQGYQLTADSAVNKDGTVYFSDAHNNRIMKIDLEGRITTWKEESHGTHGVAFGPDGRLYAGQHDRKRIVAFSRDGAESVVAEGMQTHHFTVTSGNRIYFSDAPGHKVWTVDAGGHAVGNGHARVVSDAVDWPRGVRVSPDRSTLVVNAPRTEWVWQFRIQPDGSLTAGHPFCQLKTRPGSSASDAGGMAFDSEGLLYIATNTGSRCAIPRVGSPAPSIPQVPKAHRTYGSPAPDCSGSMSPMETSSTGAPSNVTVRRNSDLGSPRPPR
jgi:sugar lactone lactonase YvrE